MQIPYQGKLAIFTSFYSYQAFAPYTISLAKTLLTLSQLGVKVDYLARPSDFSAAKAVNNTLTDLMGMDYTDVLLIDSDESWEPEGVVRLLMHPQEIVGASYRMKNLPERYVGMLKLEDGVPVGKMLPDGSAIVAAERVAAGFMRIKVSALRRWAAAYPNLVSEEPDGKFVQFFSRMLAENVDGRMVTFDEDMAFCKRWRDIGGELWIDPMVKVGHWWMENHQGDYHAHLLGDAKAAEAIAVVEAMAADIQRRAAA